MGMGGSGGVFLPADLAVLTLPPPAPLPPGEAAPGWLPAMCARVQPGPALPALSQPAVTRLLHSLACLPPECQLPEAGPRLVPAASLGRDGGTGQGVPSGQGHRCY